VVTPDIHYKEGRPGESAFISVISCVQALCKMPWVDKRCIGIQGESFGGYETNYILAHTNMFAAAMSSAGVSDLVSSYGSILERDGESRQHIYELTQSRIGATLWDKPEVYIKNSPVFDVKKITTPLLMMNNKGDVQVPFSQGVEFFLALRRLRKSAWMLQYDNGNHSVFTEKEENDYSIRLMQFFNHYLKHAPAPIWMTQGIPARLKQIESGYAYDPSGNCGKDCKVCKYWNEKFKKDSTACWKEIEERKEKEHWQ
jgi:dipeptidyl aminopeptidase/acylaminoacyl peptidase